MDAISLLIFLVCFVIGWLLATPRNK